MKKILSIIALCLIAVLAGTIIIFSCVDKSYNLNLTNPDYIEISVNNQNGKLSYYKNSEQDEYREIYNKAMSLYNNSYKQKIMSAIFSGTAFDKATIVKSTTSVSSLLSSGTYLIFNYSEEQTLTLNGKTYTYTYSNGNKETNIKYNTLYVEVKDSSSITDVNIYVKNTSTSTSYYHYVVKAKQADLYKYLNDVVSEK